MELDIKTLEHVLQDIKCKDCGSVLNKEILGYRHDGGYEIKGFKYKQWLYKVCPQCHYEWSLAKLGIKRED